MARVVKISVPVGNFSAADTAFRPPVLLSCSTRKHTCYTALHPQVAPSWRLGDRGLAVAGISTHSPIIQKNKFSYSTLALTAGPRIATATPSLPYSPSSKRGCSKRPVTHWALLEVRPNPSHPFAQKLLKSANAAIVCGRKFIRIAPSGSCYVQPTKR